MGTATGDMVRAITGTTLDDTALRALLTRAARAALQALLEQNQASGALS